MKENIKYYIMLFLGALLFMCGICIFVWLEYNRVEASQLKYLINNFKPYSIGLLSALTGAYFLKKGLNGI